MQARISKSAPRSPPPADNSATHRAREHCARDLVHARQGEAKSRGHVRAEKGLFCAKSTVGLECSPDRETAGLDRSISGALRAYSSRQCQVA